MFTVRRKQKHWVIAIATTVICEPYRTKAEALEDARGMARTMKMYKRLRTEFLGEINAQTCTEEANQ